MASVRLPKRLTGINPKITGDFLNELTSPNCKITTLRICPEGYRVPLNLQEIEALANALVGNSSIHTLDFSNVLDVFKNPLEKFQAFKAIAFVLQTNHTIETVFLDGNFIPKLCCDALAHILTHSHIKHLNMLTCRFEDTKLLLRMIENGQNNPRLTVMNLNYSIRKDQLNEEFNFHLSRLLKNKINLDSITLALLKESKTEKPIINCALAILGQFKKPNQVKPIDKQSKQRRFN